MSKRKPKPPRRSHKSGALEFLDFKDEQILGLPELMASHNTTRSAELLVEEGVDKARIARLLMRLRKENGGYHFQVRTDVTSAEMRAQSEEESPEVGIYASEF